MKKQYISPIVRVVEFGAREDCLTSVSAGLEGGGAYDPQPEEPAGVKEQTFELSGDQGVWQKAW